MTDPVKTEILFLKNTQCLMFCGCREEDTTSLQNKKEKKVLDTEATKIVKDPNIGVEKREIFMAFSFVNLKFIPFYIFFHIAL